MDLPGSSRRKTISMIALGAVVVVTIIVATGAARLGVKVGRKVESTETCGSCHAMTAFYETWQDGSHRQFTCSQCHGKVNVAAYSYRYKTNTYAEPIHVKEPIGDEVCLRCHNRDRAVTPPRDLIIPHELHLTIGVSCVKCHANVVHRKAAAPPSPERVPPLKVEAPGPQPVSSSGPGSGAGQTVPLAAGPKTLASAVQAVQLVAGQAPAVGPGQGETPAGPANPGVAGRPKEKPVDPLKKSPLGSRVPMDRCMTCHNGEMAPKRCETCHLGKTPAAEHNSASWSKTHGSYAFKDVLGCHSCHEYDLAKKIANEPKDNTVETVIKYSRTSEFCSACHDKRPPGHTDVYIVGHGQEALSNRPNCATCHEKKEIPDVSPPAKVYCSKCHFKPHQGNWIKEHKVTVKKETANSCFKCHGSTSCSSCHATTLRKKS
ncbi:MAG: hypothetical protein M1598_06490 [Actinobacteria bacterium]|nr:hypothetical protein [Actinomycetota bacterium]